VPAQAERRQLTVMFERLPLAAASCALR